ncbi:MAG: flagellar basal body rod protein FlgB [Gudongella sp.]|nr:flagellar basal body rod protein FlgB [Gudongella sp.]
MSDNNYALVKKALDVSSLRQRIISSNIANINTPGFKVNKVEFEDYLKDEIDKVTMKKTDDQHYGVEDEGLQATIQKRETTSINENGNNVDVDIEMAELAANEIYYSTLIQILNSKYSKLNATINR